MRLKPEKYYNIAAYSQQIILQRGLQAYIEYGIILYHKGDFGIKRRFAYEEQYCFGYSRDHHL